MTLDELDWAPALPLDPGRREHSPLVSFLRDCITHMQLRQPRTNPQPQKGKPVPTHAISTLPQA